MRDIVPGSRVLLLQGPMGPFFKQLANWLTARGAVCWKINFNGGDWFYYPGPNAVDFRGEIEEWPEFLEDFLRSREIDKVFLFGACRAGPDGRLRPRMSVRRIVTVIGGRNSFATLVMVIQG